MMYVYVVLNYCLINKCSQIRFYIVNCNYKLLIISTYFEITYHLKIYCLVLENKKKLDIIYNLIYNLKNLKKLNRNTFIIYII